MARCLGGFTEAQMHGNRDVASRALAAGHTGLMWPDRAHWLPHLLVPIFLLLQTLTLRPVQSRQKQAREACKSRCMCAIELQILKALRGRRHGKWAASQAR